MSYQEAARIRKKSFMSTLTEKLVEGRGIGSALKGTISDRSAARAKGFGEKIDPMNIIKFMTGGSKLAAAMYGSLRGRSSEDMKYFAGSRAREVGGTATKIGQLESQNESAQLLLKIYEFMRTTAEQENLRKEKEFNRKEELEYERSLRHKALIEALSGIAKPGKTVTATKETDSGGFGGIFASLISFVKGLIDSAVSGVMAVINGIKDSLGALLSAFGPNAISILTGIGKFFLKNPIGIAIVAGIAAGEFLKLLVRLQLEDQEKNPEKYKNTPLERAKREDTTMGVAGERNRRESVKQFRAPEIRDALNAKPAFTDEELIEIYGKPRAELQAFVNNNPNGVLKPFDRPIGTPTSQAEAQDLENGISQRAMPVPTTPSSNQLNEKTKEMNDANLPKPVVAPKSETINTTNIMADKKIVPTGSLPSVRNTEPTFSDMILYSTRVV